MNVAVATAKENGSQPRYGDFSIKKISEVLGKDRMIIAKRLQLLKYRPILESAKLKIFRFDEAMEAALLEVTDPLNAVRVRKETAAAEKIELAVAEAKGELASVAEFTDIVQRLFGGCYKENVRMIKKWSTRVVKFKTAAEAEKFMLGEYQKFSNSLRADFIKFLAKK